MRIGNQLTEAGFFGIQVGNKIDLGFDSCEHEHITQILEKSFFNKNPFGKYENEELDFFEKQYALLTEDEIKNKFIFSPYTHIGKQNVFIDIEPFDGLLFKPSIGIARNFVDVINMGNEIYKINV